MKDIHSLSHTKWNCKYHVVFAPKYRRKVFYGEKRLEIGAILRQLCEWKGVNIINAEVCPDHVHMLIEIPPKMSVSTFMGYLKGKSSLMIYGEMGKYEVQVQEPRVLVPRILRGYGRQEHEGDQRVHKPTIEGG